MVERTTTLGLGLLLVITACNGGGGTDTDAASTTTQPSTLSPTEAPATGESTAGGTTLDEPTAGSMSDVTETNTTPPTTTPPPTTSDDTTTAPDCDGLECQVDDCGGAPATTTLRGTVYAPEGTLPLYNVTVYVPNAPLPPITEGVTCNLCNDGLPGDPLVATLTDTTGQFVLEGVPAGADIPLVITVGKWRRELTIPAVTACADNPVDAALTRLPRNQSEGHIPRIAMTTGSSDPFECLLRKLGIVDSEFTLPDAAGRVNLFVGANGTDRYNDANNGGADFPEAVDLWNDLDRLKLYDILLMGCEGGYHLEDKSEQARENVATFADIGGRLFLEHWHEAWIINGPGMWPDTAEFSNNPDLPSPVTALINTGFPKGQALSEWMVHVGGSTQPGEMEIVQGQHTIDAIDTTLATRWVYTDEPEETVQYFTFNAPVGAPDDQQCGRVVDSDIHVSSGDQVNVPFPDGCTTTELTPQEKALIFMFFELSSCLIPDDMDPIPG